MEKLHKFISQQFIKTHKQLTFSLFIFLACTLQPAYSQWVEQLQLTSLTNQLYNVKLTIAPNGSPYFSALHSTGTTSDALEVRKYENNDWTLLGGGIADGPRSYTNDMVISSTGTILTLGSTRISPAKGNLHVKKYDSIKNEWVPIFSIDTIRERVGSLAVTESGVIYVAYKKYDQDELEVYQHKNGQGHPLPPLTNPNNVYSWNVFDIEVSPVDGTLYIAYRNHLNQIEVYVYNSTDRFWSKIGANISANGAPITNLKLKINADGSPIIGYTGRPNVYVAQYDLTNNTWLTLGGTTVNDEELDSSMEEYLSLTTKDNSIYCSFTEGNTVIGYKSKVKYWAENTWNQLGGIVNTPEQYEFFHSAFGGENHLYALSESADTTILFKYDLISALEGNKKKAASPYPNPTDSKLTLNMKTRPNKVSLINSNGELIEIKSEYASNTLEIDLSTVSKGLYILNVINEGESQYHSIIKQ